MLLTRILRKIKRTALSLLRKISSVTKPKPKSKLLVKAGKDKPTIGLVGFFGWGNYGDELFVDVWKQVLGKDFNVKILFDTPKKPYYSRGVDTAVASVDAIVIGGGDIVIPWTYSDLYWKTAYLKKPVFVAGVGVPTWGKEVPEMVDRLRAFFQDPNVKYVHARDPESAAWMTEKLAPTCGVAEAPDLVCALDLPPAERTGQPIYGFTTRKRASKKIVDGEVVVELDDYEQLEKTAIAMQAKGYHVRHIILGTDGVGQDDYQDALRMQLPGVEIFKADNCEDLSRAIGECTVLASMKFHGTVVATMYGVPSVVMMPTDKSRNFMRRIDRYDLISHYTSDTLVDLVTSIPAPIAPESVAMLRSRAQAELENLVAKMHEVTKK